MVGERKGEPCSQQVLAGNFSDINKRDLQTKLTQITEENPPILVKKELQRSMAVYYINQFNYKKFV